MVEASEADVVRPTVTANDPDTLLNQRANNGQKVARSWPRDGRQTPRKFGNALPLGGDAVFCRLIGVEDFLGQRLADFEGQVPNQLSRVFGLLIVGEAHAQAELGVVFKK